MAGVKTNEKLFREAEKCLPGGVNSPVRSFRAVGGFPVFVRRGRGPRIYGEDGREYIDYCGCWGALILGHAHPRVIRELELVLKRGTGFGTATQLETELARAVTEAVPSIELLRLTNSGTEAVMSAVRVARAFTGREKIIKFEGSYHGHADYLLVKAGSGASTLGVPDSLGVPRGFTRQTVVLPYNDLEKAGEVLGGRPGEVAAVIVEPVSGNMGVVPPRPGFLEGLRKLCDRSGALLIFDEVITGFRLAYGGAQEFFGVIPDLTCLGKVLGGGLPIGAYGGRREVMELIAPRGGVYQAGTLSGNPLSVTAGLVALRTLKEEQPYRRLETATEKLCRAAEETAAEYGIEVTVNRIGSIFSFFFAGGEVVDYRTARNQDREAYKKFFQSLLRKGVYLSPSGFETNFVSTAHGEEEIGRTEEAIKETFREWRED